MDTAPTNGTWLTMNIPEAVVDHRFQVTATFCIKSIENGVEAYKVVMSDSCCSTPTKLVEDSLTATMGMLSLNSKGMYIAIVFVI